MEFKVETASILMLKTLHEIEKQCFGKEAFSKQQISLLLTDNNAVALVVKVDDRIAGFIIGIIEKTQQKSFGHIITIDIAPPYRRMEIAKHLMLEIESFFKKKGLKECHLEVRENNFAAVGLYEKVGYKKITKLEHYYGSAHGLYLKKTI